MDWKKENFIKHYFVDYFDTEDCLSLYQEEDQIQIVDRFLRSNESLV